MFILEFHCVAYLQYFILNNFSFPFLTQTYSQVHPYVYPEALEFNLPFKQWILL